MIVTLLLFIFGFFLLIRGADSFIDGASALGKRFHVSEIAIGLTIVAFGTSAPEFAVNMIAAARGNTDIALGNVIGSNIANALLILGVAALIFPLSVKKTTTFKEVPFAFLAAVVVAVLGLDVLVDPTAIASSLGRADGVVLLSFFVIFLYYIASIAREEHEEIEAMTTPDGGDPGRAPMRRLLGQIVGGLAGLILGGMWVIDGAVTLAGWAGISETIVGITIVAVGTSLPELVASIAAARKHKTDIIIGNIVGSNIFNTFWILGATALVTPIPLVPEHRFHLFANIAASIGVMATLLVGKPHVLERWGGGVLLTGYTAYIAALVALP